MASSLSKSTVLKIETLSIYRGQARTGIGDGNGIPLSGKGGEQYLYADAPLRDDHALQDEIRRWLTLSPMPAHYQQLKDNLESWSCFSAQGYFFVVRLVAAGVFDKRVAYFAHARAWRTQDIIERFDPGLYLGQPDAFDEPCRDTEFSPKKLPNPNFDRQFHQLDKAIAKKFLTAVLFALEKNTSLIVSAPLSEFSTGSLLSVYLAFARAALPKNMKKNCTIRIYTSDSRLFLGKATVLVVAEEQGSSTLTRFHDAILIDSHGEIKTKEKPREIYTIYAEILVSHLNMLGDSDVSEELPLLSALFLDTIKDLSSSGLHAKFAEIFEHVQLTKELETDEISFITKRVLNGLKDIYDKSLNILGNSQLFSSVPIEVALSAWWEDGNQRQKQRRVLDLLVKAYVSPGFLLENLNLTSIGVQKIIALNSDAARILFEASLDAPEKFLVWLNTPEFIAEYTDNRLESLSTLIELTVVNKCTLSWLDHCDKTVEICNSIFRTLPHVIDNLEYWDPAIYHLFKKLSNVSDKPIKLSDETWKAFLNRPIVCSRKLEFFANLAEVLILQGIWQRSAVIADFWFIVNSAECTSADAEKILAFANDNNYSWLGFSDLADDTHKPELVKLLTHKTSDLLFANKPFVETASVDILLTVFNHLQNENKAQAKLTLYTLITLKISYASEIQPIVSCLIRENLYFDWFLDQKDKLPPDMQRNTALSWLGSPEWQAWNQQRNPPEPTLEAWVLVMACFKVQKLTRREMASLLRGNKPSWPMIYPFERSAQLGVLCRVSTIDALSVLNQVSEYSTEVLGSLKKIAPEYQKLSNNLFSLLDSQNYGQLTHDDIAVFCVCECVESETLIPMILDWVVSQKSKLKWLTTQQYNIAQNDIFDKIVSVFNKNNSLLQIHLGNLKEKQHDELVSVCIELIIKRHHSALASILHPKTITVSKLVNELMEQTSYPTWQQLFSDRDTTLIRYVSWYIKLLRHNYIVNYERFSAMLLGLSKIESKSVGSEWMRLDDRSKMFLQTLLAFLDQLKPGSRATSETLIKLLYRKQSASAETKLELNVFLASLKKNKLAQALIEKVDGYLTCHPLSSVDATPRGREAT